MNRKQRAHLSALQSQLETIKDEIESMANEEQDKFDNMPESLQGSERGQAMENAADLLASMADEIGSVTSEMNELI